MSTGNDSRRPMAFNDITLPSDSNGNHSFLRRRVQQSAHNMFNGQLDKSSSNSSSTKSSVLDDNSNKISCNSFSLLRHHSSPNNPKDKSEKSAYDNLTNATLPIDPITIPSKHLERKSSFPLNRRTNRHPTNDSLASDAYDNIPEKNGYDNYPIRKTTTSSSIMTSSQNDVDGKFDHFVLRNRWILSRPRFSYAHFVFRLDRHLTTSVSTTRNEFNTKRSQSINLKTPFNLKSTMLGSTNDENKRSGSVNQRTTKSSLPLKEPLCNLNAASCSPLNEHVRQTNVCS